MATRIYGWDQSHYDGPVTTALMVQAKAEGIAFVTHKIGEGISTGDDMQGTALAAARDAGFEVIGGYWFIHGNDDPAAEVAACIAQADAHEPWWRTFPGWFWQTDAETSPTGLPSPAYVKAFSDQLAAKTGKRVIVYASHGMYGDRLSGLGHPLWNANYGSNAHGAFAGLYPGDNSAGWGAYSGQTPVILQYGSGATIAGRTTCDINAFKGTIDDLLTLIGADMTAPTPADIFAFAFPNGTNPPVTAGHMINDAWAAANANPASPLVKLIQALQAQAAGIVKSEAAIQATLAAAGGNADTAALAAQIKAVGDTESAAVAALQAKVADLEAKLAAAATAEAAALAP